MPHVFIHYIFPLFQSMSLRVLPCSLSHFPPTTPYSHFRSRLSYTVPHSPRARRICRKSVTVQTALNFFWFSHVYTKITYWRACETTRVGNKTCNSNCLSLLIFQIRAENAWQFCKTTFSSFFQKINRGGEIHDGTVRLTSLAPVHVLHTLKDRHESGLRIKGLPLTDRYKPMLPKRSPIQVRTERDAAWLWWSPALRTNCAAEVSVNLPEVFWKNFWEIKESPIEFSL